MLWTTCTYNAIFVSLGSGTVKRHDLAFRKPLRVQYSRSRTSRKNLYDLRRKNRNHMEVEVRGLFKNNQDNCHYG